MELVRDLAGHEDKKKQQGSGSAESTDERQAIKKIQSLQEQMDSAAQT